MGEYMSEETTLNHVALQCLDKEKAEIFFTKVLGLKRVKNFVLSKELSKAIFGIDDNVKIDVYENNRMRFEIFIGNNCKKHGYEHTCIEVKNKKEFISCCKSYEIEPIIVKKKEKELLFVKDFSDNLYEIKERAT